MTPRKKPPAPAPPSTEAARAAIARGDVMALRAALGALGAADIDRPDGQVPLLHAALRREGATGDATRLPEGRAGGAARRREGAPVDEARTPLLDALLDHGADPDVVDETEGGRIPALAAAGVAAIERLLRAGADPEALVVPPPGQGDPETARSRLARHASADVRGTLARLAPPPDLFTGLAGAWDLIAETRDESGGEARAVLDEEGSFTLHDDGRFELIDPAGGPDPYTGTWRAEPGPPDAPTTHGTLTLDDDRGFGATLPFTLRRSRDGLAGDRLSVAHTDEETRYHGAVRHHFARRGSFHRVPVRRG